MKGITVTLYERQETGRDKFNRPIFEEIPVEVKNVLVAPATNEEAADALDIYGKKILYTLALPKGDAHEWENAKVSFFNQDFRVVTFPAQGIEHLIPLSWNAKVQVAAYE